MATEPPPDIASDDDGLSLAEGLRRSGLSFQEAYTGYRVMGGTLTAGEVSAVIAGAGADRHEYNKLAARPDTPSRGPAR